LLEEYVFLKESGLLITRHLGPFVGAEFQEAIVEILPNLECLPSAFLADVREVDDAGMKDSDRAKVAHTIRKLDEYRPEAGTTLVQAATFIALANRDADVTRRLQIMVDQNIFLAHCYFAEDWEEVWRILGFTLKPPW